MTIHMFGADHKDDEFFMIVVRKDGEAWFAHDINFKDLMESDAEFGDSPADAAYKYLKSIENKS